MPRSMTGPIRPESKSPMRRWLQIHLRRDAFHGEWNYEIIPRELKSLLLNNSLAKRDCRGGRQGDRMAFFTSGPCYTKNASTGPFSWSRGTGVESKGVSPRSLTLDLSSVFETPKVCRLPSPPPAPISLHRRSIRRQFKSYRANDLARRS